MHLIRGRNSMILKVENLKTYFELGNGVKAKAVDGISFGVEAGKTLAIVGESGCGKSQTAFSIMRLVSENCVHGDNSKVIYNNKNLLDLRDSEMQKVRGNEIAMIFQEPMSSLNPLYRVGNQLAEPLILHQKMTKVEARKRGIELLKMVGIPEPESRIDNYPHEISGGMKQRVMIAMALACRPKILIADEPTTALDVTIQAQILKLMQDLQRETGMAIIMITHDLGVVNQVADDVCVMYGGKVAEIGTREQIFNNMQHPYTRRLLESIPAVNDISYKLNTILGIVPPATIETKGCRFADRCIEAIECCRTIEPRAYECTHGTNEHRAYCHLLDTNNRCERMAANTYESRPQKDLSKENLLAVADLKTHFPVKKGLLMKTVNHVKAVDGFSIDLNRGETLALVGESGCGKTTAGQSILRLIGEAKGEILFKNQSILELGRKKLKPLRQDMQIVFQDPFSSLSPRKKVGDIILEGLKVHHKKMDKKELSAKLIKIMDEVGLDPSCADRYPHEFSGGQRQRIAIARALILEPELLVLDEPTSALDVSVQAQILNLLEEIQVKRGLAYIFITHDLGVVEYIADRVAVMYLGKIVEEAQTKKLFSSPSHPYSEVLLDAVPQVGEKKEFLGIDGEVPSPINPPAGCHFHTRCPYVQEKCKIEAPELQGDTSKVACHFPLNEV